MQIGVRIEESWPQFVTVSMVGGTIRRKVIHRESFRASVLHHSENQAVLQSIATKKCLLTTPSLLSRGTQIRLSARRLGHPADQVVVQFESSHLTIATEAWKPASLEAMPPQSNIM